MPQLDHSRSFSGFEAVPDAYRERLWPEAQPFLEKGGGRAAVVVLHGYGATPFEVRPVARACATRGMDAVGPLQTGHGYRARADQRAGFGRLDSEALVEVARSAIRGCRERGYERVFAFGLSMGGALALHLAAEGQVDAVAVAAPAVRIPALSAVVEWLPRRLPLALPAFQPRQSFENYAYGFHTVVSLRAMREVSRAAHARLADIRCPVLVMQTRADPLIPVGVGDEIEARVQGPVERRWFDDSGHSMTVDVAGPRVAEAAASFLAERI